MEDTPALNPALQNALRQKVDEERLTPEQYQARVEELQAQVSKDFKQAVDDTVRQQREDAIAKGAPPTVQVDQKAAELRVLKNKEDAVLQWGRLIVTEGMRDDLPKLFEVLRPLFVIFPKARMAKITKILIDMIPDMPGKSDDLQIDLCQKCIQWCTEEKRTFLRHRMQTKLASLYHQLGRYQSGLELLAPLLKEIKKLDDKLLLVEVHLVEAKLYFSVRHVPKSKAALTAAKTNANAIHCPPLLQADIDLVAGSLHAEEKDFRTAYSYFFEAFEAFHVQGDERAVQALKYMMLCRIMSDQAENITYTGRGNAGLKYLEQPGIQCLMEIAKTYADRDLLAFEQVTKKYRDMIEADMLLSRHIDQAQEQLLEQSVTRMVMPYSEVDIDHVAKKLRLSSDRIVSKLSEMVLDGKLRGTLDQGRGVFLLFEQPPPQKIYKDAIESFSTLREIIDILNEKAQRVL